MSGSRRSARRIRVAALLLLAGAGCAGEEQAPASWSAVLITLDTTRADALTAYGGRPGVTPHLDRLAEEGIRFERAYTVAPLTLPAHASMLTGLYPPRHGLRDNGNGTLPASATTLAEQARASGFATAAFVASVVLDPAFGLDQGFETYDAPRHALRQVDSHYSSRRAHEVVGLAADWLRARDRGRRFFLWVHLWDPHGPFDPEPPFDAVAPDHPYLGEVAAADRGVGDLLRVLDETGARDETVVLVVADHGEAFWEHGEFSHGSYCWDTTLRVPLILWTPDGRRAGERAAEVASVVDVLPTLAAAMGLPAPGDVDGMNLLAPVPADRGAYLESYHGFLSYGWSPLVGWVDARGKYVHGGSEHLFAGPDEERDLAAERDLEPYRAAIRAVAARPRLRLEEAAVGEELRERIRGLGYAALEGGASGLPEPLAPTGLPSPMERVDEHREVLDALGLFNAEDYAGAEAAYRAILAGNPRNHQALDRLAICLIRQRRHVEAIAPLQRVVDAGHAGASTLVNLGTCMRAAGNHERAVECFEEALALDGSQVRALGNLIDLLETLGRGAETAPLRGRFRELTGEDMPE